MATVDWSYWWWTAGILAAVFIVGTSPEPELEQRAAASARP